ncbi:MAG: hypothetical protein HXY24_14200 [Rubrivivax sp.]|nr:hypothetical protein [Rubrivivax sp.]
MTDDPLSLERAHLSQLVEAVQRCVYFLDAAARRVAWPLDGAELQRRQKDVDLFESLAAFNERFAKLQDTLGAAMRHAALLLAEPTSPFLKVLALYEKLGVLPSLEVWQACRTARNLAAHDYEAHYPVIAEHFNTLRSLLPMLMSTACRFVPFCEQTLNVRPASPDFAGEFIAACEHWAGHERRP